MLKKVAAISISGALFTACIPETVTPEPETNANQAPERFLSSNYNSVAQPGADLSGSWILLVTDLNSTIPIPQTDLDGQPTGETFGSFSAEGSARQLCSMTNIDDPQTSGIEYATNCTWMATIAPDTQLADNIVLVLENDTLTVDGLPITFNLVNNGEITGSVSGTTTTVSDSDTTFNMDITLKKLGSESYVAGTASVTSQGDGSPTESFDVSNFMEMEIAMTFQIADLETSPAEARFISVANADETESLNITIGGGGSAESESGDIFSYTYINDMVLAQFETLTFNDSAIPVDSRDNFPEPDTSLSLNILANSFSAVQVQFDGVDQVDVSPTGGELPADEFTGTGFSGELNITFSAEAID